MYGSHLSIAGGMENAVNAAHDLSLDAVQVFTKNQRQWTAKPLADDQITAWRAALKETGLAYTVSHDSYLINLASPKRDVREKSIRLYIDELERCEALGIPHLVMHPGAHLKIGEEKGLDRVVRAFDRIHKRLPGYETLTCLEITAGQGTTLGYTFEHLKTIIDGVAEPERLAVCFDTAHALAAGYDLTSEAGAKATFDEFDDVIGLDRLAVFHVNDSKTERGSRVDRHAHIGQGHVALDAFAHLVNRFPDIPKILETPKEDTDDGTPMDTINVNKLKSLQK